MYCDARTDVPIHTQTLTSEKRIMYIKIAILIAVYDKKNQRFYTYQFNSNNSSRNYLKPTIIESNIQVFHRFRLSS